MCNTFFKHRLENTNTWTSNFIPETRRNPFRNQIDFILAPLNFKQINTNAYASNNTLTSSDHKIVLAKFLLGQKTRHKIYRQTKTPKNVPVNHLSENKTTYNSLLETEISNTNFNTQTPTECWTNLCNFYLSSTQKLDPQNNKAKYPFLKLRN